MIGGLDIAIKKARISKIQMSFSDNENVVLPQIIVEVELMTKGKNVLASIEIGTNVWSENRRIKHDDIDSSVFAAIRKVIDEMTVVATRKLNGIDKFLTDGREVER